MSIVCPVRTRIQFFKDAKVKRKLLGEGKILVKKGQSVVPSDVIAKVEIRGKPLIFDLPQLLKAKKPFSKKHLLKKIGERVEKGEKLVCLKSLFFGRKTLIAPCGGEILEFKESSGQLVFQPETREEVQVLGLFWGEVEKVGKNEVVFKTSFVDILGVLGIGEASGKILICRDRVDCFSLFSKKDSLKEEILVFEENPGRAALEKLKIRDASGVICGGVHFRDFQSCQKRKLPLLVTEGFGKLKIGEDLLGILQKYEGRRVLLEGEEKRLRIPLKKEEIRRIKQKETKERELKIGDKVRLIGEPGPLGVQGTVEEIGRNKVVLESGFKAVLVKVKIGKETLEVPSSNLEVIETR